MDHNLEDSLNLESMDFDHSEDVVNQEDIPLENSGRLDSITMDMDDVGDQSHPLMESVSDEVIVSDLIEDPFPFQEYILQSNAPSSHNIMVDPHQLNRLTAQPEPGVSLHTDTKPGASAKSNVVSVKVAQPKPTKRLVAAAPPREVAIAPKPPQSKLGQYAIAPKPVALVPNKQTPGAFNKIPISSSGNVKGSAVLTQLKKQLVMVPKKIKLMSSAQIEGVINTASSGIQYQVACTSEQAQLMANQKGNKPLLKLIQIQGQSGADKGQVFTNVPRARYVMQQKTVPLTKIVQGPIISGKKKIITIKPQNPTIQTSQGNVTTKKVVISTSQAVKDSGSTGQRTQFHPINVPGKGIQYIKLVTNQPQKSSPKVTVPPKNFVFTDSKGNVIQMTAEKVLSGQSSSIVVPGTVTAGGKGVVKAVKTQKKFVRIAPVSKAVTQSNSQPARSSQSLLAPMTSTTAIPSSAPTTSLSLPSLSSPVPSPSENAVSIEEFNDMVEQNKDKSVQQLFSNYIDNSRYSNDFTMDNDLSCATEDYSTANEYSTIEDSQLHDETVAESINLTDESVDVKPTLQSLISDAVSEERESDNEMDNIHNEVEIEFERKRDSILNASFMLQDDQIEHDTSNPNQESIILVPGSNYTERINDSMYSDDSQSHRNRDYYDQEDTKRVPLLSVEAECLPYNEDMRPESPSLDPDAAQMDMRPRKACNCTKSQCLKLYCDCFTNGEFCNNCNCKKCHNNLENEEIRQKAIRSCLERNPNAFRPKIGKSKTGGPEIIRRHTKGCNCKRSGCLKNYCECYEAKIACTAMCKCVGCRNVEETLVRRRDAIRLREKLNDPAFRPTTSVGPTKQPCSFMTTEVIEAVCQCLVAAAGERDVPDPVHYVIDEFARCLQDVISASHHTCEYNTRSVTRSKQDHIETLLSQKHLPYRTT